MSKCPQQSAQSTRSVARKLGDVLGSNGSWPWPLADMPGTRDFFSTRVPPGAAQTLIYADQCLRGVSEVVFVSNPISGLIIVAALLTFDVRVSLHGLLGVLASTGAAKMLRSRGCKGYDGVDVGLDGFNGFLVGLGIATFTDDREQSHPSLAVAVVAFGLLCCVVQKAVASRASPLPCLTLPFNICAMWFLGGAHSYRRFDSALEPGLVEVSTGQVDYCIRELESGSCDSAMDYVAGFLVSSVHGVSQIYLAQSALSGLLILAGIGLCSPVCMALVWLGSAVGSATALLLGGSPFVIYKGLWGFNPALTCCAIGGGIFGVRGPLQLAAAVFGAAVTVFLQFSMAGLLAPGGLVTFTCPFCFVTLLFLAADLVPPRRATNDAEQSSCSDLSTEFACASQPGGSRSSSGEFEVCSVRGGEDPSTLEAGVQQAHV